MSKAYYRNNELSQGLRSIARKHQVTILAAYVLNALANGSAGHYRRFAVDCDLTPSQALRAARALKAKGLAIETLDASGRGGFFGCSEKGMDLLDKVFPFP